MRKLPWDCYLPLKNYKDYRMPPTRAKSHKSKLYHSKLIREILLQEINDLPLRKEYGRYKADASGADLSLGFKRFKKQLLAQEGKAKKETIEHRAKELEDQEEAANEGTAVLKSSGKFKSLDLLRKELLVKAHDKNEAHAQGKVMVNIVKDKGEVLLSTSYEALHKHGYKPFMRWGVLKETLTAACLLESGILERANRTGKLHLWDPFCGSGSFLIESLMMLLNRPCRSLDEPMPFQNWPIHDNEKFETFRKQLEEFKAV